MGTADKRVDLLCGTLDLLILGTLVSGSSHGRAIARHIQRVSEDAPRVEGGRRQLAVERSRWEQPSVAMARVLHPADQEHTRC